MLVKSSEDQNLIKVMDTEALFDPFKDSIQGRLQAGQEEQPPRAFSKSQIIFPSGESLPECWTNPDYLSA